MKQVQITRGAEFGQVVGSEWASSYVPDEDSEFQTSSSLDKCGQSNVASACPINNRGW